MPDNSLMSFTFPVAAFVTNINELKIRRRHTSGTADLVEGAKGEAAEAIARKTAYYNATAAVVAFLFKV